MVRRCSWRLTPTNATHPDEDIRWKGPNPSPGEPVIGGIWNSALDVWENTDNLATGTATALFGRVNGWQQTDLGAPVDPVITIDGGGVPGSTDVVYDGETHSYFRLNSDTGGTGQFVISGGATLELRSSTTPTGVWTEIDAKGITVTGAGSKFSRTHTNTSMNGGAFVWGSWRNDPGEVIDIKVLDSAELDNEGQIWFGAYNDSAIDLTVRLKIDENASVKAHGALRGGHSLDNTAGPSKGAST